METARLRCLGRDQGGAAILEFTVVAGVMFIMLFGIVEFANLYSQWNAATKAVQVGARLAAVSGPVWETATSVTGFEGENPNNPRLAGAPLAYSYTVTCTSSGCSKTGTIPNNVQTTYSSANMGTLVFGRGSTACNDGGTNYPGMCDIFPRIRIQNVRVIYEGLLGTSMGYIGRPGGIVPTIKVEVFNLPFQFIFLDDLMAVFGNPKLNQVPIPGLTTTISAEDMRSGAPAF